MHVEFIWAKIFDEFVFNSEERKLDFVVQEGWIWIIIILINKFELPSGFAWVQHSISSVSTFSLVLKSLWFIHSNIINIFSTSFCLTWKVNLNATSFFGMPVSSSTGPSLLLPYSKRQIWFAEALTSGFFALGGIFLLAQLFLCNCYINFTLKD